MMQNKKVVGITGGSGTGKSYISDELRKKGFAVIDADKIAHESINSKNCIKELTKAFGEDIITDGKIDRKALGSIVFSSPEKLEMLNRISHKYILEDIAKAVENAEGDTVFVDGAVLIESGMKCDMIIGVIADKKKRKQRIMSRDKISENAAEMRISAQQDDEFYRQNCDFVVTNNGGAFDLSAILSRI